MSITGMAWHPDLPGARTPYLAHPPVDRTRTCTRTARVRVRVRTYVRTYRTVASRRVDHASGRRGRAAIGGAGPLFAQPIENTPTY